MGRDANMLRGHMAGATAQAMNTAAANEAGAAMGFMGMGMAQNMAGNMTGFFQGGQQAQQTMQSQEVGGLAANDVWLCECGSKNTGKFCSECGKPRPATGSWTCSCGAVNNGKFCSECGSPRK